MGLNPEALIDEPGMVLVLSRLDMGNALTYKPGMAPVWLDLLKEACRLKHHPLPTLQVALDAATRLLIGDAPKAYWVGPRELFGQVWAIYTERVKAVTGGNPVEAPEGLTAEGERLWKQEFYGGLKAGHSMATAIRDASLEVSEHPEMGRIEEKSYRGLQHRYIPKQVLTQIAKPLPKGN